MREKRLLLLFINFGIGDSVLLRFEEITIQEREPLDLTKNPYIDIEYFRARKKQCCVYSSENICEYKQRVW